MIVSRNWRPPRKSRAALERQLRMLAREFRGTRDEHARVAIARKYARAVKRLIDGGGWRRIPPLEDQLPDEWLPEAFFEHWSLSLPGRE